MELNHDSDFVLSNSNGMLDARFSNPTFGVSSIDDKELSHLKQRKEKQ